MLIEGMQSLQQQGQVDTEWTVFLRQGVPCCSKGLGEEAFGLTHAVFLLYLNDFLIFQLQLTYNIILVSGAPQ